jgi:hypothetical protein
MFSSSYNEFSGVVAENNMVTSRIKFKACKPPGRRARCDKIKQKPSKYEANIMIH